MARNIGKIKLGKKDKRAFFDMSNTVDSTLSYGFVEPTMCLDLIPNTKLDVNAFPGVRLAPLPQPTTGKVKVKTYYSYVHTEDVFEAFENLQSGTSVSSSRGSYTPTRSNVANNFNFFAWLLAINSQNARSMASKVGEYSLRDLNGIFFNYSISSNYDLWTGNSAPVHNLFDDVLERDGVVSDNEYWKCLAAYYDTILWMQPVADQYIKNLFNISSIDSQTNEGFFFDWRLFGECSTYVQLVTPVEDRVYTQYMEFMHNLKSTDTLVFSQGRSVENADFVFECPLSVGDVAGKLYYADNTQWGQEVSLTGKKVYIGIHLTPAGKRLFKIFNALEYNFGIQTDLETDKLSAYYKAWFEIFNPGRVLQWKATNCYKLIHSFYDSPNYDWLHCMTATFSGVTFDEEFETACKEFITDLVECYYTEKIDPITVATETPVLLQGPYLTSGETNVTLYGNIDVSNQRFDDNGYGQNEDEFGGLSVRFLNTLYHLVNKNSVIGQRVALYMKEHFGINTPKTSFVDVSSFDVDIVDATATVNNDQTQLGEYAGKGLAKSQNGCIIETKKHGYFFQFVTVVPIGGYVQSGKLAKQTRMDWYQPEYDSLGMEPISQYEVNSRNSVLGTWKNQNEVFGFRPRYFKLKYKNNLHNGGFSFRSERSQFLGYSLDKVFSEPDYLDQTVVQTGLPSGVFYGGGLKLFDGVILAPDEELRYLGKNEQFGNYNRIFYDTTGMVDNFILYIDNQVKMYAPMKPISDSFEAFDETSDTDVSSVEHS